MTEAEYIAAQNLVTLRHVEHLLNEMFPCPQINMEAFINICCQLELWIMDLIKATAPHGELVRPPEKDEDAPVHELYEQDEDEELDEAWLIEVDTDRFPDFGKRVPEAEDEEEEHDAP